MCYSLPDHYKTKEYRFSLFFWNHFSESALNSVIFFVWSVRLRRGYLSPSFPFLPSFHSPRPSSSFPPILPTVQSPSSVDLSIGPTSLVCDTKHVSTRALTMMTMMMMMTGPFLLPLQHIGPSKKTKKERKNLFHSVLFFLFVVYISAVLCLSPLPARNVQKFSLLISREGFS